MIDQNEIRRERLKQLRDTECNGSTAELARRIGKSPSYVMRTLYKPDNPHQKKIGVVMIDAIEAAFNLPPGWLNRKRDSDDLQRAAEAFLDAWDSLTTDRLEEAEDQVEMIRKALDQLPDTTKMIEPIGEIVEAHGLIAVSIPEMPPVGTKLYAAPPKRE